MFYHTPSQAMTMPPKKPAPPKPLSEPIQDLIHTLGRNPGCTEANIRSTLSKAYGNSKALDEAIEGGYVIRQGFKLFASGKV